MSNDYDLTSLGLTKEPETVEPGAYVPAFNEINNDPVDKGVYTANFVDGQFKHDEARKPVRIGSITSKKNGEKYLSIEVALDVTDAKVQGKIFKTKRTWGRVNTMPESLIYQNVKPGRENANSAADMLVAAGWKDPLHTNDDFVNAVLTLVEQKAPTRVRIDKSAYCNPNSKDYPGCGNTVRGEDSFTGIPNGGGDLVDVGLRVKCPGNHTDETRPILLAKNEIKAFYPLKK